MHNSIVLQFRTSVFNIFPRWQNEYRPLSEMSSFVSASTCRPPSSLFKVSQYLLIRRIQQLESGGKKDKAKFAKGYAHTSFRITFSHSPKRHSCILADLTIYQAKQLNTLTRKTSVSLCPLPYNAMWLRTNKNFAFLIISISAS